MDISDVTTIRIVDHREDEDSDDREYVDEDFDLTSIVRSGKHLKIRSLPENKQEGEVADLSDVKWVSVNKDYQSQTRRTVEEVELGHELDEDGSIYRLYIGSE